MTSQPWHTAPLVALDLEGSGAQDREREAILELALVPLVDGAPDLDGAFSSLVNPGREIRQARWISPGLTNEVLSQAPVFGDLVDQIAEHINDRWLVGHNIGVDWRLLHRHAPQLQPAGLIDTLRLGRAAHLPGRLTLTAILDQLDLTKAVSRAVPAGRPHRALWDAAAVAILLPALTERLWPGGGPGIEKVAGQGRTQAASGGEPPPKADAAAQDRLF